MKDKLFAIVVYYDADNRVVVDETGTVEEVNYYTPFGALMADSSEPFVQPYKYNGKKLDTDNALNWYYYGARYYDAALGRWLCMDPLAEKYYDVSPYAYCHNNPVNLFDPDGMDDYFDFAGKFMKHTDSGNDILMQTRNGGFINITQVDYSNQTDALLNIGTYYLSQVDKNFKLTIGHTGGENPLDAALTNFSGTENYELLIDDNGRINQEYGNSSNFINSFYHETRHRYDATTWGGGLGEVNAILAQTTHRTWWDVSDSFAQSQASYAARELNEAWRTTKGKFSIEDYLQRLNSAFFGFVSFSIVNGVVTFTNEIKGVVVYGKKRK